MKLAVKILVIVIIFIFGFYTGQQMPGFLACKTEPVPAAKPAAEEIVEPVMAGIMFDFGEGNIKTFNTIELPGGSSVFDLLKKAATDNNIALEYKDYGGDMGVFIESIGEEKSDFAADKYWQFWVNNEYAVKGASLMAIQDGDIVLWKFTSGQFKD